MDSGKTANEDMSLFCRDHISPHVFAFSKIGPSMSLAIRNPRDLLFQTNRFDLMAKLAFAMSVKYQIHANWFQELYIEHIRYFNNFNEANFPDRKSGVDFVNDFISLIRECRSNDSITLRTIPIDNHDNIIDGAHRLVIASINNKNVYTVTLDKRFPDTHYCFNYDFFLRKGMPYLYSDYIAYLFCKTCERSHLMFVFPRCKDKWETIHRMIRNEVEIFYCRSFSLTKEGSENLIRLIYANEPWVNLTLNGKMRSTYKTESCFGANSGERNVLIYVISSHCLEYVTHLKAMIRDLCMIGTHSVHCTDSHEETIRVAEAIFNRNTRIMLNIPLQNGFENFSSLLDVYKGYINFNKLDKNLFCVDGSAVMSACGMRDCNDLDFLYVGSDQLLSLPENIECHNKYYISCGYEKLTGISIDDIVFNPNYHFYYNGVKMMRPELLRIIKRYRNESKDKDDTLMISRYLNMEAEFNSIIHDTNCCEPWWYSTIDKLIEHNSEYDLPHLFLNARFSISDDEQAKVIEWLNFIGLNSSSCLEAYYIFDIFRMIPLDNICSFYRETIVKNTSVFSKMNSRDYLTMWVCLVFYFKQYRTHNDFWAVFSSWYFGSDDNDRKWKRAR